MRYVIVALAMLVGACSVGLSPAQKEQLSATQAVVDQRVRAGQMTPEEGRAVMAKLKADMEAQRMRTAAIMMGVGDSPAVFQPVGGGTVIKN